MADQVVGKIPAVVDGAVQEARLSSAQETGTEEIHAGSVQHHTAVVAEMAGRVEHRNLDPREVGMESCRPHDRGDLPAVQIQRQRSTPGDQCRFVTLGGPDLAVQSVFGDPQIDVIEQASELLVGRRAVVSQPTREHRQSVADGAESTPQLHACGGDGFEIEGATLRGADELRGRHLAGLHDLVDLVVTLVESPDGFHPVLDVGTAVRPRHPNMLAHRQRHRPTRRVYLLGEL